MIAEISGLFAASFLAATLIPAQSEAVLVALVVKGGVSVPLIVCVAGIGNVLGSLVNWWLGRCIDRFRDRRWFPVSAPALERAQRWYGRFGRWSLLFAWLPVVGDPLTLVAGIMREPLPSFLILVAFGKFARYALLAFATLAAIR
ncbi:DedA family protein [Kaistia dalseonensis]|uniref:Membrane protein YqaA with SNARE-associated domain n=1 Tax=Kaistia dalseonensis TaxID=410840 RepID=A0ABU0H1D2_9HYPH|nr:YqaA family protein [Kaistia dalseonensis]MCX5493557.1 DedA family protein [Kaistia dalseonensis]MDQ0436117.1 membrane protein YqaA with SNARE-associated domain [Kaistia dalseonensis]